MISIIVAMSRNRVIGKDNQLPWHLPADLAYFKKVTMGHPILMGRKTYESIGRPLPGRTNVILTRQPGYAPEGCTVVHTLEEAMKYARDEELFVIGGAEIIKQVIPLADKLYLTYIDHDMEGDTFLPECNDAEWKLISKVQGVTDERNPYTFFFLVYERNK